MADLGLFFIYKIARNDLRYWLNIEGLLSWVTTMVVRLVIKVVVDFTLMVHLRKNSKEKKIGMLLCDHFFQNNLLTPPPSQTLSYFLTGHTYELGGLYWSANLVLNQAFCFIAVYLYQTHAEGKNDYISEHLWEVVGVLFLFSVLSFCGFLCIINKKYIPTFFTTASGKDYAVSMYEKAETDALKFEVFDHHPSFYDKIVPEIMTWLDNNWDTWEVDMPDWFVASKIKDVPPDMLPVRVLAAMGGIKGRRASIDAMKKEEEKKKVKVKGVGQKDGKASIGVVENGKEKKKVVKGRRGSNLKIVPMG